MYSYNTIIYKIFVNLRAELLVLPEANVLPVERRAGNGFIGVAWVSYVAGSAATLLSQWPVENAELITSFHQEFKMHTPNALQQATIKLLNSPAFRHPVHWAGFTFLSGIK